MLAAAQEERTDGGTGKTSGWNARDRFRYAGNALSAAGFVSPAVAAAIARELDDAMVVRSLLTSHAFHGRRFPDDAVAAAGEPASGAAGVWLEAEVERHLDLVVAFDPARRPHAADEALAILGIPLRAFAAAGGITDGGVVLDELAASLSDAGFPVHARRRAAPPRGEWVEFLRSRPRPLTDDARPEHERGLATPMGTLAGVVLELRSVAWSAAVLEVELSARPHAEQDPLVLPQLLCRALDDRDRLHVGQVGVSLTGGLLRFRLRPGLEEGVRTLALRVSAGGGRVETTVAL